MQQLIVLFTIVVTFIAYFVGRYVFARFNHPLASVILVSTTLVIIVLLITGIPHAAYLPGMEIMTYLLGPATVALAVPVYRNRGLLREYALPVIVGVIGGSLLSITIAMLIVKLGGMSDMVIASIAAKSATIPFAVPAAQVSGGDPSLAVAFVVATGTFGGIFGLSLLTLFKISDPSMRGLAMGMVSHGQGVALALTEGERQGAMAGVAMALTGIFTSIAAPLLIPFFIR